MPSFFVISFYKFFPFFDVSFKEHIKQLCTEHQLRGSVLVASEGINASLEGEGHNIDAFTKALIENPLFSDVAIKKSPSDGNAFKHLRVVKKNEIVALGRPDINPTKEMGHLVAPQDWDAFISEPDVVLIDTRNSYEIEMGSFAGAINPSTRTFKQFPEYIEKNRDQLQGKKIAMYCTGGIRCEKASAYLIENGFEEVYQLSGGILNYLDKIPFEKNTWQGECMVFDKRWMLDKTLKPKPLVNQ